MNNFTEDDELGVDDIFVERDEDAEEGTDEAFVERAAADDDYEPDADERDQKPYQGLLEQPEFLDWLQTRRYHPDQLTSQIVDEYYYLQKPEFLAWLRARAYHPDQVTAHLDEYEHLQRPEFLAWLRTKGYHPDQVTSQIVDEYDWEDMARVRRKYAELASAPPSASIEEIDPARVDPDEWVAAQYEWVREGHPVWTIPLACPKFEALIRRRIARLDAATKVQREKAQREKTQREEAQREKAQREERENQRRNQINSLRPPKLEKAIVNAQAITEAQTAYQKGIEELSERWAAKYNKLPYYIAGAWEIYHEAVDDDPLFRIRPRAPAPEEFPDDPDELTEIEKALADPSYLEFQRYSEPILQRIEELEANVERLLNPPPDSRPPLKGWSLEEIDESKGSEWLVPELIPHGLTFVFGQPKGGKSLWMQKLSACIAGGVPFDGIQVHPGGVLYITRDIGASRQEVKKRLMKILPRLSLSNDALNGKLILTDDPFYLNDAASVDNLLANNPGPFALVVIDSLFRCVVGSLSQDVVASAAVEGIDRISRATGAAVVAIHHEPRGGEHLFGSVMLDAAYDAQIHVERGKERNTVTVTVQELKNAPIPDKPFIYRIEEEYLAPVASAGAARTRKQAGNISVDLLQESGLLNRFAIHESWSNRSAYDANEKAPQMAAMREGLKSLAGAPLDRRAYRPLSIGPTRNAGSDGAVYMVLFLDVFPPGLNPTLAAVKDAAVAARKGEGNLRYDVEQEGVGLGNHMIFYAAWQNRDDFDSYEKSDYARHLRNVVGPLLGSPYDDRLYALLD